MHHSPHTARWIDIAADLDYDFHFFPLDPGEPHQKLRNLTFHVPFLGASEGCDQVSAGKPRLFARAKSFLRLARAQPLEGLKRLKEKLRDGMLSRSAPISPANDERANCGASPVRREYIRPEGLIGEISDPAETIRLGRADESDATAIRLYGPEVLSALIRQIKPDLIHSMEFQHSAYLVLAARDLMTERFPRWLATNWGSDIFYFGNFPDHAKQIRRVCGAVDLYSCECHRDLALGRKFGYRGPDMPVLPNSGGMDIKHILSLRDPAPPSKRKVIMVKGYDHFAGRAMVSLAVLERFANHLQDYTVVLFSVGARPRVRALELAEAGTLDIRVIDLASHDDILRHFGKARIYLGISISDAISTSVLEAMAMGAFPIQTNTSCCEEWFVHGKTGFAIPPDDFEEICERFATALSDDSLVDYAATENFRVIESRLALEVLRPKVADFYRQALLK